MKTAANSTKISVIIPYFQREQGILHRALASVLRQNLPSGVAVDVIVVDDGSPVPAHLEVAGLVFKPPFRLILIPQTNGGVAAARNTGLEVVEDNSRFIAFLDSDDSWHDDHLRQGIEALEQGNDFYFCDNRREGHHDSYFESWSKLITTFISSPDKIITPPKDALESLILRDFVTQASTVIYRRSIAPDLLFEESVKNAGEDLIFFMRLAKLAQRPCFLPKVMVECGRGVNIYFSNLDWNSDGNLRRIIDRLRSHLAIKHAIPLTKENAIWNDGLITTLRRNLVFHTLRKLIKSRGAWPCELQIIAAQDKWFPGWFAAYSVQVVLGKAIGLYHPD